MLSALDTLPPSQRLRAIETQFPIVDAAQELRRVHDCGDNGDQRYGACKSALERLAADYNSLRDTLITHVASERAKLAMAAEVVADLVGDEPPANLVSATEIDGPDIYLQAAHASVDAAFEDDRDLSDDDLVTIAGNANQVAHQRHINGIALMDARATKPGMPG